MFSVFIGDKRLLMLQKPSVFILALDSNLCYLDFTSCKSLGACVPCIYCNLSMKYNYKGVALQASPGKPSPARKLWVTGTEFTSSILEKQYV